jgi:hypothetical protein
MKYGRTENPPVVMLRRVNHDRLWPAGLAMLCMDPPIGDVRKAHSAIYEQDTTGDNWGGGGS